MNLNHQIPAAEQGMNSYQYIQESLFEEVLKDSNKIMFTNRETEIPHNPYDQELREMNSIETGDIQQLKNSWAENYVGNLGTLAKDELRNRKNLSIAVIVLASRAAIRGGVLPEISFSLCDSYIQKLEELTDPDSISALSYTCELHYTQMVREIKNEKEGILTESGNPLIHHCKNYIFSHLHGKISIRKIAGEMGVNASYLSECFKKYEGINLKQFITKEKINLTRNMLIYSRYSYIEIAAYLGFSSQSHLGKIFKKETGYTLKQYRKEFGAKNLNK